MYCFKPIVWKKSFNPWLHTIFAHRLQKVFLLLVKQLRQKTRIFFFVDNGTFSPASSLGYWKAIDSLGNIFILVEFEVTIYLRHDLWNFFFTAYRKTRLCIQRWHNYMALTLWQGFGTVEQLGKCWGRVRVPLAMPLQSRHTLASLQKCC